jgi:hypothetical protein
MISWNLPSKVFVSLMVHRIQYVELGTFLTFPPPLLILGIKIVIRYVMVWQSNVLPLSSGKSLSYTKLWREPCSLTMNVGSLSLRNVLLIVISYLIVDCWNDKWNQTTPAATVVTIKAANCNRCTVCWYDSLLNPWVDMTAFLIHGELCVEMYCWTGWNWCQPFTTILMYCALPFELRHAVVLLYSRVSFFTNN